MNPSGTDTIDQALSNSISVKRIMKILLKLEL